MQGNLNDALFASDLADVYAAAGFAVAQAGVGYDSTMRSLHQIQKKLREHKDELRERYGVKSLRIFGSYARGEQTPESDVDILVELEKPIGLRYFELWDYLEAILGRRVDLLTPGALRCKPRLQQRVQEDLINV